MRQILGGGVLCCCVVCRTTAHNRQEQRNGWGGEWEGTERAVEKRTMERNKKKKVENCRRQIYRANLITDLLRRRNNSLQKSDFPHTN